MTHTSRSRLSRFAVGFAIALRTALPAASLFASEPALAQRDPYKQHMENGVKLYNDKNYTAALSEFRAAYKLKPTANPLINIALCYKAQFNYPKSIQYLEDAQRDHAASMDAADKKATASAIQDMRALLAYVTVRVTPDKAVILVDGEDQAPNAAGQVALGPGTHKVGARLGGHATQETSVTVASGEKHQVLTFKLVADKGWVLIRTDPNNVIAIDSNPVGKGQYEGFLTPGTHLVQLYTPGKPGYSVQLPVVAGRAAYVTPGPRGVPIITGAPPSAPAAPAPPRRR